MIDRVSKESLVASWRRLPHPVRWVGVAAVGGTLVVVGLVLLVLPGPGIALIALGLVVLATEFAWAEATLDRVKRGGASAAAGTRRLITRTKPGSARDSDGD
jgi:hypothetical protein